MAAPPRPNGAQEGLSRSCPDGSLVELGSPVYTWRSPKAGEGAAIVDTSGPDRDDLSTGKFSSKHRAGQIQGRSQPSEGWLRAVLEHTSNGIMVLGPDGTIRYTSPAVEGILGYQPEDLVGAVAFDHVHAEDAAFVSEAFGEIVETPGAHAPIRFR